MVKPAVASEALDALMYSMVQVLLKSVKQFRVFSPWLNKVYYKTVDNHNIVTTTKTGYKYTVSPIIVEIVVHSLKDVLCDKNIHMCVNSIYDKAKNSGNNIELRFVNVNAKRKKETIVSFYVNVRVSKINIDHSYMHHDVWQDATSDNNVGALLKIVCPECNYDYFDYDNKNMFMRC